MSSPLVSYIVASLIVIGLAAAWASRARTLKFLPVILFLPSVGAAVTGPVGFLLLIVVGVVVASIRWRRRRSARKVPPTGQTSGAPDMERLADTRDLRASGLRPQPSVPSPPPSDLSLRSPAQPPPSAAPPRLPHPSEPRRVPPHSPLRPPEPAARRPVGADGVHPGNGHVDDEEPSPAEHAAAAGTLLEPHEPRQLGPYRVLTRLGQGGFGSVYLGVSPAGRQVAIKVLRPEFTADGTFRERFRREAASAQRVARHSTAEVLDFDDQCPRPYLVTEYVEGPTLHSWVRRNGPMHGSTLEQLAIAVASALAAIHRAGIVHRDLKPSNVLLSPTGPRVIDFGIARAVDASDVFSRGTTQTGTLGYMAPEQIRGQGVTPKTDVFAWGALVAYAGTGTAPFGTGDPATIMYRTLDAEPELGRLDGALRRLAHRALAKDPDGRPAVTDLLTALDRDPVSSGTELSSTVRWETARPGQIGRAPTMSRPADGREGNNPPHSSSGYADRAGEHA